MAATLKLEVEDITQVMANYNVIQVSRSEEGPPDFSDALMVTADSARKPFITGTLEGPFTIQGMTLKLSVDGGGEQTVLFQGDNPIALPSVISEAGAILVGVTPKDSGGKLQLEGNNPGSDGTLEITGGTALAALGLTLGDEDTGEDQHITLLEGVTAYDYVDGSGSPSHYYRVRYYSTATFVYSAWSDWMQIAQAAVAAGNLILAVASLAEVDGDALYDRGITIKQVLPIVKDGYAILAGVKRITSDGQGVAQTYLVRGSTVDVIFEGTSIVRRIVVPLTGTSFDLLDASLVQHDPFEIQIPDIPFAIRRS